MKKTVMGIVPGLVLIALATPGFAENRQGAMTISPFVGGYVLDHNQREESRPVLGLRAGYNFTKNLGAEAMFGYALTETKQRFGSRETDLYRYGIDILYHFMPDNNLVPFVALGGGGTSFITPDSPSTQNHWAGLVNYGVGLKYFVSDNVALRGDVRHVLLVQDTGDNNLEYAAGLTFQFGGAKKAVVAIVEPTEPADSTPPTVTFTSPAKGDKDVHVNEKISVAFSEEMDTSSFNGGTVSLMQGTTPVSGQLTSTDSSVTFIPASPLEKGKSYTGTVTSGAKDLAGNTMTRNYEWGFTAGAAADTVAPTVSFTSPVKDASAAPLKQKVNVAFSENMDTTTITPATFTLKQGTTPVAGKVSAAGSNATFAPAKDFEKGKVYTGTMTTGAKDLAGNALAKDYAWDFKAYAAPKVVGILVTLENSHFDFDSVSISENGKTILNHNVTTLKNNPTMKLRIAGYTSASGTDEYNQKLSERRAEAVRDYLVKSGIAENRLSTIGYGKSNPAKFEADPSDTMSPAALANMRVVIEVVED